MKPFAVFLLLSFNICSSKPTVRAPQKIQAEEVKRYPQGYFRDPLDIPITLAANFGELRNNHFHMGLDIRTNQRENLTVRAAADGYVSKIKIERFGFGRAIYITHPNGYTTLYAHLNDFYPELNNYVKEQQYADEQWEQEIDFQPNQFPVKKGQFIAYSGNTGGSQGPHLHFEIRDTKTGNNLNPLLFGFGIADNVTPFIYRLYYYDRRYSSYEVTPNQIPITGANGNYTASSGVVVLNSPYVNFGIAAEDKNVASSFRYGIFSAELSVDDEIKSAFKMDNISYNDTRYINGSIDFKTKASGGGYIQYLNRLPGNQSTIFNPIDGNIMVDDTITHRAKIVVSDAKGNKSILNFKFRFDPAKDKQLSFAANSIPLVPNQPGEVKGDGVEVSFSAKAFYDTVPFVLRSETTADSRVVSAVHYLHNYKVPVHDSFSVRLRPTVPLTSEDDDKIIMQLLSNKKKEAMKAIRVGNFMEAKFRDLGIVKLVKDLDAPKISLSGWVNGGGLRGKKSFTIYATDNASEIKSFNAWVDNKWLLFSRKDDAFIHTFDNRVTSGTHELKVRVEDLAGNVTEKTFSFKR